MSGVETGQEVRPVLLLLAYETWIHSGAHQNLQAWEIFSPSSDLDGKTHAFLFSGCVEA